MNTCCSPNIVDVDCLHESGRFILGTLPGCLPSLYTARFRAPVDYVAGDVIVVDEREYAVLTPQMEPAATNCFKSGAVVMCEIDRDRKYAFIRAGGATSGTDVEFQTSSLVYYIDPLGDDSPNNPGGVDSPFKTLAGAGRAAWEYIVMNPLGKLVFSFNPGTYELTEAERALMTHASHPLGILFKGTDVNNKPLLRASDFISNSGKREYQGVRLYATGGNAATPYENATTVIRDVEVVVDKSETFVFGPNCGGVLRVYGSLKIDAQNNSPRSAFHCNQGILWITDATVCLENFASVTTSTIHSECGFIYINRSSFSGIVSGRRYMVVRSGVINTLNAGAEFIPGTIAGIANSDGKYY
ncbi:MAG: hypothetical protein LUH04_03770 [Clostridium sp.]|nr:hypothetical protein [Clostridium sp.]